LPSKAGGGWSLVRLISLQAQNFKKLRINSPITFSNGITLISGLNESGKSTVLDAILYALFGRVTRPPRARNEDLVAYGANEGSVSLDFEVGDRSFRVSRRLHKLKPTRAVLEEIATGRQPKPLANGQEKVNEEIVRLLGGITYQEMVSSTVVAQKELSKLIELNKDDRKRIINAFLSLESFNTVMADLTEERRELEGTGSRIGNFPAEKQKLELLEQELAQFQLNSEEKARLLRENAANTDAIGELRIKFQDHDRLYNNLRQYETELNAKSNLELQLSAKRKLHNEAKSNAERLNKEVGSVQEELTKYSIYDRTEPLISRLNDQYEAAKNQSVELTAVERSLKEAEQEVSILERKMSSVDEASLRRRAAQLEKPIRPYVIISALLLAGALAVFFAGFVPVALVLALAGIVPAAIAAVRLQAAASLARGESMLGDQRYLDARRKELAKMQQENADAKERYNSTERELVTICQSLSEQDGLFKLNGDLKGLRSAQSLLDNAAKGRQTRGELQMKLQTLSDEVRRVASQTNLNELEKEIEDLTERLNGLVFPNLPEGAVFTRELIADTLSARDGLSAQLATTQSNIHQNLRRIADLDKYLRGHEDIAVKVRSQSETVQKLERRLRVVTRALEIVQATGEALRNRVRPSVQAYMSAILPALTSGKYRAAVLDDDYNLKVWDPEAGEYKPKEVYSGGTEDQFLLAMRLAFALALLPEVKGQKPEFVFLDEPLGSSDDVRRSGIVDYLTNDLSLKFKQIFVISHVGGLEEHVQNIITLDDGMIAGTD
jgi:exonuclease SbcC